MRSILITGSAGFIGSHLCESLLSQGYTVTGVDNFDPFYPREIKEKNMAGFISHPAFRFHEADITGGLDMISGSGFDAVIHLAAKAGVRPSIMDPSAYIHSNIIGTQRIHEFMQSRGIRKLIFASSSSIYGNNPQVPFRETDPVDHPISPYAFTKKACELMNHTVHHLNGIDIMNLRFFTVFGPRQRPDLAINKFVHQVLHDEEVVLYGKGDTARDYTYIDDIVKGICQSLEYVLSHEAVYEIVNLGNHSPVRLSDLVDEIYKQLGRQKRIVFAPMQPGDVDVTYADIDKARALFGYQPSTGLATGIKNYIEWVKTN